MIGGAGIPMYPGSQDQWGVNGAWSSIDGDSFFTDNSKYIHIYIHTYVTNFYRFFIGCNELPPYPSCAMNLSDSMVDLCRY